MAPTVKLLFDPQTSWRHRLGFLLRAVLGFWLLVLAFIGANFTHNWLIWNAGQTADFFEYHGLQFWSYGGGELYMQTLITVHRQGDLAFNRRLYCDTGDGFAKFSEDHAERRSRPKTIGAGPDRAIWRYAGETPPAPARCYIENVVTISSRFGHYHHRAYSDIFDLR